MKASIIVYAIFMLYSCKPSDDSSLQTIQNFSGAKSERPVCGGGIFRNEIRSNQDQAKVANAASQIDAKLLKPMLSRLSVRVTESMKICQGIGKNPLGCISKISFQRSEFDNVMIHVSTASDSFNSIPYFIGMTYAKFFAPNDQWLRSMQGLLPTFTAELASRYPDVYTSFKKDAFQHAAGGVSDEAGKNRSLALYVFAESFDSYYCTQTTRQSFEVDFPETYSAFERLMYPSQGFSLQDGDGFVENVSGATQPYLAELQDKALKEWGPKYASILYNQGVKKGGATIVQNVRDNWGVYATGATMLGQDAAAIATAAQPIAAVAAVPTAAAGSALAFSVGVPLYVGKQIYNQKVAAEERNSLLEPLNPTTTELDQTQPQPAYQPSGMYEGGVKVEVTADEREAAYQKVMAKERNEADTKLFSEMLSDYDAVERESAEALQPQLLESAAKLQESSIDYQELTQFQMPE
jgi:hypothetical protein